MSGQSRMKIMIVDDSEIVREMVKMMLEEGGYDVVTVDSPFGFNSAMKLHRPDLVLVDVAMPALKGDKLVEIARRNELHSCPIVLFSDRPEGELQRLTRASGASGYICKTNDSTLLLKSIAKFLNTASGS
jgi:CheY-like chemotaxis protein